MFKRNFDAFCPPFWALGTWVLVPDGVEVVLRVPEGLGMGVAMGLLVLEPELVGLVVCKALLKQNTKNTADDIFLYQGIQKGNPWRRAKLAGDNINT